MTNNLHLTKHNVHAHDHFFRTVMADQRVARDFLTIHLPKDILCVTDLNNLTLQPRSYINEVRRETIVDILYKTTIADQEAYIYLILEHQSTPDELMPYRMLKYTCHAIDHELNTSKKKSLPFVFPMVIYHAERPYPYSTDIRDIVDAPKELVERYFLKPFQLIDLGRIEDEQLKQQSWAGVMEFALKHIFARDILPYVKEIADILRYLAQSGGEDYVSIVLQYFLERSELRDKEAFFELINTEISVEIGERVMTLAERLVAEGMQKGMQEGMAEGIQKGMQKGMQKGKLEVAESLLSEGLALDFIAKVTGLPAERIKELQEAH